MAKSMRSKIKRRFRAIKRQSIFAPVETARIQRLAAKQIQTEQQTNSLNSQDQSLPQHETEVFTLSSTTDLTSDMIIDTDSPKISTSGPRNSRHQHVSFEPTSILYECFGLCNILYLNSFPLKNYCW
ncbi:fungal protein [Rhizophagus clarus]|uniref:Fungal protein n=1 Tax=Rhizophagus clarus TaxID=94130 RepID=A0A8H3KZV9_9GLOM|nr:fungal protein [Rhizophagus clarus]